MKSTTFLSALVALATLSSTVSAYTTAVAQAVGCYSSAGTMEKYNDFSSQSSGNCSNHCVNDMQMPIAATSAGTLCYCGSELPPSSAKVDSSNCNTPCGGYSPEMCGGTNFWTVYTDGLPLSGSDSGSSGTSQTTGGSTPTTTSSAKPSLVTLPGQTVVVTASVTPTGSSSHSSSGGGPSKAGIAAGVVVGIVAAAAIAGGTYLFIRNRKRRQVEEEYRRNAAINSIANGKPPTSSAGASSFTDTRLDPTVMAQRRMSDGSIADNQDYSRRILKVTNA